MVLGYDHEGELMETWEKELGIPVVTSAMNQIEALQATRGGTDETRYQAELEKLLVAIALKGREIRDAEAADDSPR